MNTNCNIEKPSVINYILKCFKCYFDFKGRACKKEFWSFALFSLIITIWLAIVISELVNFLDSCKVPPDNIATMAVLILKIPLFIPFIAVAVRRLHDLNKSGWYVALLCLCGTIEVIYFFPIEFIKEYYWYIAAFNTVVYAYFIIFIFLKKGNSGENKYGADPLQKVEISNEKLEMENVK